MASGEEFEVAIPNDTAAALAVQERILDRLEALDFSPRDVFGCRLALEEALMNAYKHGNDRAADERIFVRCRISPDHLYVEVEDEGPGFDPEDVPDCTAIENLEKPSGRGIMLMRSFMDRIEHIGRGNIVVLEKRRVGRED